MSLNSTAGDPAADSYGAVSEADAYFAARGNSAWTGTVTAKEGALRVGTTYLENQYRTRWVGIRATQIQSLAWPRVEGTRSRYYPSMTIPLLDIDGFQIDINIVPKQVKNATFEAALLALTGVTLEPRLLRDDLGIKSISKGVDVLKKDITYRDYVPLFERYTVIEGLLRGLVTSTPGATSGVVTLIRG